MRKTMICEEVEIENIMRKCQETCSKTTPNLEKIESKPSKIDACGLKNRPWALPRHHFGQSWCFKSLERACPPAFWCPDGPQTASLAAILDSKTSPNGDLNLKNVTSKNNMTFTLIFSWFTHDLGVLFLCVFHMEILLKSRKLSCKKAYETLAMATKSKVGVFEMFVKI